MVRVAGGPNSSRNERSTVLIRFAFRVLFKLLLVIANTIVSTADLALAQPLPIVEPESVGMSSDRLKRISQLVRRKTQDNQLVGAVTMVARRGKLVHFESFGLADVEANKPLDKDAIFRIYSMTKPITSVAAMMLYEQGKFQLYDPLHKYLPEFEDVQVYEENIGGDVKLIKPSRRITVRDLFTHTSGLTYGIFGSTAVAAKYREANVHDESVPLEEMVRRMAKMPLLYNPGHQWHYGRSTDVLGRLIEVVSDMTLDEFFLRRIFEPLGMMDTAFYVPSEKVDRFPVNYRWDESGNRTIADDPATSRYLKRPVSLSGGGGLLSTPHDYLRFCQMLLNGGELGDTRLLSPKTVKLMTMNHLDEAISPVEGVQLGPGAGFGLGFRVILDPSRNQRLTSAGCYGWGGMASTMFFIDPQEQLVGIIMTQKFPTDLRLRDEFQTAIYQAIVDSY